MIQMEIDSPENEISAEYAPGDHAVIYPNHADSEVDFVMEHLTKKPSELNTILGLYEYNQNEGTVSQLCRSCISFYIYFIVFFI
jgi:sulfite reductase alpha subunit-like flavoprotein